MSEDKKKLLQTIDLARVGNLLEDLIVKDIITCEERDRIIQRIAADNGFPDYKPSILAGYGHRKDDILKWATHKNSTVPLPREPDETYVSLTEIVRTHSSDAPGYVIQSWLRSGNTLAFLNL